MFFGVKGSKSHGIQFGEALTSLAAKSRRLDWRNVHDGEFDKND